MDAGAGDRPALVWDSAMTGEIVTHTYRELRDRVAKLAGALAAVGVTRGDRVVIYMPMVPEAAIAMLACARLGAVHSVVFGGFAASELAARIDATSPRVVIAASCGLEPGRVVEYKPVLDEALALSRHRPEACFVLQRPQAHASLLRGSGPRPAGGRGGREPARSGAGRGDGSALHPAHLRYDGPTEGHRPRQRRARGRSRGLDPDDLRTRRRGRVSGPRPTSGGWSDTPTSSMHPCSPGSPR